MMTKERRAALLAYCRIDWGGLLKAEKVLLESMYDAAVDYMAGAGVSEPAEGTPRRAKYDLCVNALVLDAWDKRGTTSGGLKTYTAVDNPEFRRRINQLKLSEPAVSKSDT